MSTCTFRTCQNAFKSCMGLCSVWHFNRKFTNKNFKDMIFSVSVLTITGTRSNLVACMEEIIPKINEVITFY